MKIIGVAEGITGPKLWIGEALVGKVRITFGNERLVRNGKGRIIEIKSDNPTAELLSRWYKKHREGYREVAREENRPREYIFIRVKDPEAVLAALAADLRVTSGGELIVPLDRPLNDDAIRVVMRLVSDLGQKVHEVTIHVNQQPRTFTSDPQMALLSVADRLRDAGNNGATLDEQLSSFLKNNWTI